MALNWTEIGGDHYAPVTDAYSLVLQHAGDKFIVRFMQRMNGSFANFHGGCWPLDTAKQKAEQFARNLRFAA